MDNQNPQDSQPSNAESSLKNQDFTKSSATDEAILREAQAACESRSRRPADAPPLSKTFVALVDRIAKVHREARAADGRGEPRNSRQYVVPESKPMPCQLLSASGIPARYASASVVSMSEPAPAGMSPKYLETFVDLIIAAEEPAITALLGNRGTGKTWMACAVVRDFCQHGRAAIYCKANSFFTRVKASYGPDAVEDQAFIEAGFVKPELLALDEMHERGATEWEDRMLTRLIDLRYDALRPTILISNQTYEEFTARIGESIADRIHDGGAVLVCEWKSLRGEKQ